MLTALLVVAIGVGLVASWPSIASVSWVLTGAGHAAAGTGGAGGSAPPSTAAWVAGRGVLDESEATRRVPIASLAKVMTADVVLRDHPLAGGEDGPDITVSASEASAYSDELAAGDSLVPVSAGETLTERQALEALLLPSADNMAWILARWDAGSIGSFVARMNATARGLGMRETRYTDPSGLSSSTVSTAADQVRLARAAIEIPALASIVAETSATIPDAGRVDNLNALLGTDGIVGMKTGSTSAAGGCVLLAASRGSQTTVVAVLGARGSTAQLLPRALADGRALVRRAAGQALGRGV